MKLKKRNVKFPFKWEIFTEETLFPNEILLNYSDSPELELELDYMEDQLRKSEQWRFECIRREDIIKCIEDQQTKVQPNLRTNATQFQDPAGVVSIWTEAVLKTRGRHFYTK